MFVRECIVFVVDDGCFEVWDEDVVFVDLLWFCGYDV